MGEATIEAGLEVDTEEQFVLQRKHKRHPVDGRAEVVLANGTMQFCGRILDISAKGCFIETRARLKLAPGTLVSMVFYVQTKKFSIEAVSRGVKPGRGAGFEFVKMDARTESQLAGLLTGLGITAEAKKEVAATI